MYKDKDRQREANKQAKERWKAKQADKYVREALGIPKEGIPERGIPPIVDEGIPSPKPERTALGNIRVSKPGDDDYVPQCETTRAFIEGRPKRPETGKCGKDIKCFEDLPLDVQATIDMMSVVDGKIDQTIKANRTAIAIHYQHLYPDRYYSTGRGAAS